MELKFYPFSLLFLCVLVKCSDVQIDDNGYIVYSPYMGEFGYQVDYFLGALAFAHGLNRTLVLPPWLAQVPAELKPIQVPFDTYFQLNFLQEYHRVVTMENFMEKIAPLVWPVGKRLVLCYFPYGDGNSCDTREETHLISFWDTFGVDFDGSELFYPLHYDVHQPGQVTKWHEKFPAEKFPVFAFIGTPASFPIQQQNLHLQKFLVWSDMVMERAVDFIRSTLPDGPFVGIHVRNRIDWIRLCKHIEHTPVPLAASQCLGYSNEYGGATLDMCIPSKYTILKQLKTTIEAIKARAVFVASDNDHMISEINEFLNDMKVKAYKLPSSDPQTNLAVLSQSNHFIGNCISSFTAFAKRERDVNNLISSFWTVPLCKKTSSVTDKFRDEL